MKWPNIFLIFSLIFFETQAFAKNKNKYKNNKNIKVETIIYEHDGVKLEGQLVYNTKKLKKNKKRPGILVFHTWMGNNEYTLMRAKQLADEGYIAFAADVYGQDVKPTNSTEASQFAKKYKDDRKLTRGRARAALDTLLKNSHVDSQRIAAIGYCFGGMVALELARDNARVAGVVSFHGVLETPLKATSKLASKILVLHGAIDPFVKDDEVLAFQKEMGDIGADWQMVSYGGAVHSFTQKSAGDDISTGIAYNEKADIRSWKQMEEFFDEIFDRKKISF